MTDWTDGRLDGRKASWRSFRPFGKVENWKSGGGTGTDSSIKISNTLNSDRLLSITGPKNGQFETINYRWLTKKG